MILVSDGNLGHHSIFLCFDDIQLFSDKLFVLTTNAHMWRVGVTIIFPNKIFMKNIKFIACENQCFIQLREGGQFEAKIPMSSDSTSGHAILNTILLLPK